jgi:hypothetical protein
VAIAFLYDAFQSGTCQATPILSLAFAAVCIFMFFFRRNFANKVHNRNNKSKEISIIILCLILCAFFSLEWK